MVSATWDLGDGTVAEGNVDIDGNEGTTEISHIYSEPGVYEVHLAVFDERGQPGFANYQFVVVFDPEGGFVTGGGWIYSEAGWCQLDGACMESEGKANFGFVSKYKKGNSTPDGNTEFNFTAGGLNFHSVSYDWLVVNQGGANAQFKGEGTINDGVAPNGAEFKFMIWAKDLDPDERDTFRIRIWYEDAGGEIDVYDNGFDQAIGGGNVQVHQP